MKKLINLFKRNKKTVPQLDIPKGDPKQTMYINNIIYYIEKKDQISIQSDPTDVKPYGWTIEFRWKHRDTWTNWQQYYEYEYITADNLTEDLDEVARKRQIELEERRKAEEIKRKQEQERREKVEKERRKQDYLKLKKEFENI